MWKVHGWLTITDWGSEDTVLLLRLWFARCRMQLKDMVGGRAAVYTYVLGALMRMLLLELGLVCLCIICARDNVLRLR